MWVVGIVAVRNKKPYVQISKGDKIICQLSSAEAFNFARDIMQQIARVEADAMILKFFDKQQYPSGAGAALMVEFRNFRADLDSQIGVSDEEKRDDHS